MAPGMRMHRGSGGATRRRAARRRRTAASRGDAARAGPQASAPRSAHDATHAPHRAPHGPRLARGDDPDAQSGRRARGPLGSDRERPGVAPRPSRRPKRPERREADKARRDARPGASGSGPSTGGVGSGSSNAQGQRQGRARKLKPAYGRAMSLTTFGHTPSRGDCCGAGERLVSSGGMNSTLLSPAVRAAVSGGSAIRKMFEQGIEL